jgi:hypothetical protein
MHNNKETLNYIKIVFDYLINAFGSKSYGDDFDVEGGFAFKSNQYTNEGTFVLRVTNINPDGSIKKNNLDKFVNNKELINDLKNYVLKENDILIVMVGGSLGKVGKVTKEILPALLNQNLWKINNAKNINSDYLFYLSLYLNEFKASIKTSSFGHFSRKKYRDLEIPDVKIEQSELIASFLNELCIKKNIIDLDILIPIRKILSRLIIFDKNKLEISSELTHQTDLIKQLRQAFLREAMQGKLVKSTNTKETGLKLLAKIKAEKAQLITEKKLKKEKELAPISEDEIPFEIPENWAWCRLEEIFSVEKGLVGIQKAIEGEFPLVVTGEQRLTHNEFHFEGKAVIVPTVSSTGHGHASLKRIHYQEGKFAVGNILACIMPLIPEYFNMKFIYNYLDTYKEFFFVEKMKGAANVSLKISSIKETPIPCIPIEIQNKYEELIEFCDGLEQSIKESQGYNEMMFQQVLREALQGEKV